MVIKMVTKSVFLLFPFNRAEVVGGAAGRGAAGGVDFAGGDSKEASIYIMFCYI